MVFALKRGEAQRATIVHPKYPELVVTVEKPTMAQVMEWEKLLKDYTVYPIAINPETKRPYQDRKGKAIELKPRVDVPLDVTLGTISKYVKDIKGFDVTFNANDTDLVKDMLMALLDQKFSWESVEDVPVEGEDGEVARDEHGNPKTRKATVTNNFYHHIVNQMFKSETYDGPLDSDSSTSSTEG